jgi:hypothetical protein
VTGNVLIDRKGYAAPVFRGVEPPRLPGRGVKGSTTRDRVSRSAALAADGSVYVAESGTAGPTCLDKQTVARFDAGKVRRVATGLLSTGGEDGSFTVGADGVAVDDSGAVYVQQTAAPERMTPNGVPPPLTAQQPGDRVEALGEDDRLLPQVDFPWRSTRTDLFVTGFSVDPANQNNAKGSVVEVASDGTRMRSGLGKLFFPADATVARDGAVYVSNWSILPGTPAKGGPSKGKPGQLVRIANLR